MIGSVYFLCPPLGPPENTAYLHNVIALAEGLRELGVPTYANIDYWSTDSGPLLTAHGPDFRDCDAVVIDSANYDAGFGQLVPKGLFGKQRAYRLAYIDDSDARMSHGFADEVAEADVVLKVHYNRKHRYPSNFVPWQFGLTTRQIGQAEPLAPSFRRPTFLTNFRVSQPARELARRLLVPLLREMMDEDTTIDGFDATSGMTERDLALWHLTGRRHYPAYYQRLASSLACQCFGGSFEKRFEEQRTWLERVLYKIDWRLDLFPAASISLFDNFRFWESMAAGCCALHVDFERYGAVFPCMPRNGEHYIGVDFSDLRPTTRLLTHGREAIAAVGAAGRAWVLEHYSPRPVAERFLDAVGR